MSEKITQINRDPFARTDLVRRSEHYPKAQPCDYCGSYHRRLFVYGAQPDSMSGRINWRKGKFCSIECYRQYWGYRKGQW